MNKTKIRTGTALILSLLFSGTQSFGDILLGGFDNNDGILSQDAGAAGNVSVTMTGYNTTRDVDGDTNGLWGASAFTPAASIDNFSVNQIFGDMGPISITIENTTASKQVTLSQLHFNSRRDNWKAETDYLLSATGDLAAETILTDTLGDTGVWYAYDLDVSSLLSTATLDPGKSATFTLDFTGTVGAHGFQVDNLALSGSVVPEPATLGLFGIFGLGLLVFRRRLMQ